MSELSDIQDSSPWVAVVSRFGSSDDALDTADPSLVLSAPAPLTDVEWAHLDSAFSAAVSRLSAEEIIDIAKFDSRSRGEEEQ